MTHESVSELADIAGAIEDACIGMPGMPTFPPVREDFQTSVFLGAPLSDDTAFKSGSECGWDRNSSDATYAPGSAFGPNSFEYFTAEDAEGHHVELYVQ